jgi:hypothetical protein
MKTPEEMAYEYGEKFDGVEISKNDINIAWYTGYQAAAPQWISVKDRLPELRQEVLVIRDKWYALACRRKVERKPLPPPQFNNIEIWEWDYGVEETFVPDGSVTHWMPLPDMPKEEK